MFKDNFIRLCAQNGESPTAVCKKIGLSNAAYSGWTRESIPRMKTLKKIADYFGVAPEELLSDVKNGQNDVFEKIANVKKRSKSAEAIGSLATARFGGEVEACTRFTANFVEYDEEELRLYYSCVSYRDGEYYEDGSENAEWEKKPESDK